MVPSFQRKSPSKCLLVVAPLSVRLRSSSTWEMENTPRCLGLGPAQERWGCPARGTDPDPTLPQGGGAAEEEPHQRTSMKSLGILGHQWSREASVLPPCHSATVPARGGTAAGLEGMNLLPETCLLAIYSQKDNIVQKMGRKTWPFTYKPLLELH